jgi:hypothetical protein
MFLIALVDMALPNSPDRRIEAGGHVRPAAQRHARVPQ